MFVRRHQMGCRAWASGVESSNNLSSIEISYPLWIERVGALLTCSQWLASAGRSCHF